MEEREKRRKTVRNSALFILFSLIMLQIALVRSTETHLFSFGAIVGAGIAFQIVRRMEHTWDPFRLRFSNQLYQGGASIGCLSVMAVVLGVLFARLTSSLWISNINIVIGHGIVSCIAILVAYMFWKAWKYQPYLVGKGFEEAQSYLREEGPIAFDFPLRDRELKQFFQQLHSSNLYWYWQAYREDEIDNDFNPKVKVLVNRLGPEDEGLLIDRLLNPKSYISSKRTLFFGFDTAINQLQDDSDQRFRTALREFLHKESGPLKIIIIQTDDLYQAHIYVPHALDPEVLRLLKLWQIIPAKNDVHVRPYEDLRFIGIEYFLEYLLKINTTDK